MTTLPKETKKIEDAAFEGSAVEGIIIPAGCEAIGSRAFADCGRLQVLVFEGMKTEFGEDVLEGCGRVRIEAPAGSDAETYARQKGIPFAER